MFRTCSSLKPTLKSISGVQLVVHRDRDEADDDVAETVVDAVAENSRLVLGLPTGDTPVGVYRRLVLAYRNRRVSFRHVTTFNLDEYIGLSAGHPQSYASYMRRYLLAHVDTAPGRAHIPDGMAADPSLEAERYEASIAAAGGIDLMLLGIGVNGHIGFNEPGAAVESRSRAVALASATLEANSRFFADRTRQPLNGITMGIATIFEARRIVLVASGENKAPAVAEALLEPPSAACPASFLQQHGNATFVLDEAAASLLQQDNPDC